MKKNYILCDLEATGNRDQDRIIELGLMLCQNSLDDPTPKICCERNATDIKMMVEAMEIHHITPDMLKDKKPLIDTEGYKSLNKLNTPANLLIAHDAPSDLKLLKREGFDNHMQVIDTLKCTKHLYGDLDAYRLQYLRYKLTLYKEEYSELQKYAHIDSIEIKAHNALSDVIVMKLLLSKLIAKTKAIHKTSTEDETINKLIKLSATPVLIKKFQFGKYKGEYIEDIVHNDYQYIVWMRERLTLDEDMKYTLDFYLH